MEEDLQRLVEDFLTQKQILLVQVKKGILSKEQFLREVLKHIEQNYHYRWKNRRIFKRIRAICVRLFQIVTAHG